MLPRSRLRLVWYALATSLAWPSSSLATRGEPPARPEGRDAVARALDYTVTIETDRMYGAGIIIAPAAGLVLTAAHIVEEVRTLQVVFIDGTSEAGRVVQSDGALDLALVRIRPRRQESPVLGDATLLRPGEEVFAIGCPRHLGFTVSRGVVSFVGRPMDGMRYIQSDLPINDGNSGGPVINGRGELVAIMSFVLRRAQGLSFALPLNYAAERFQPIGALVQDPRYWERFRVWKQRQRS